MITVHAGQELEAEERAGWRKDGGGRCGFECEFGEARYWEVGIGRYCERTVYNAEARRYRGWGVAFIGSPTGANLGIK
jgi:hypothetical protein